MVDGKAMQSSKEKADTLNRQFESVFTIDQDNETSVSDLLPTSSHPTLKEITITDAGILKMLNGLNVHKAAGPDQISPRILKELSSTITPILGTIFRKSYNTGTIPEAWRQANVVPIFKKGNKADPANYRPISLTSIVCKLMENYH